MPKDHLANEIQENVLNCLQHSSFINLIHFNICNVSLSTVVHHFSSQAHCGSLAREDEDLHSSSRALGYTEADMEAACVLSTFNHAAKAQQTALSTNSYVDKAVEVCTGDFGGDSLISCQQKT